MRASSSASPAFSRSCRIRAPIQIGGQLTRSPISLPCRTDTQEIYRWRAQVEAKMRGLRGLLERQQRSTVASLKYSSTSIATKSFDSRRHAAAGGRMLSTRLMAIGRFRSSTRRQTSTCHHEVSRVSRTPEVFPSCTCAPQRTTDRARHLAKAGSYRWPAHYQSLGPVTRGDHFV